MVNGFEEEVRALEEYGHDCCARIDDRIHECCKRIREAREQELDNTRYAYEVSMALMKKQPSPVTYDVLGNERHKAVCELRKLPDGYPSYSAFPFAKWYEDLSTALGICKGEVSCAKVRDTLIHLLGGDQVPVTLGDLYGISKEGDDGVDAGRRDPTGGCRSDAAADGHMADCAGNLPAEGVAPITDELRKWMDRTTIRFDDRRYLLGTDEELTAIADRIDAEHERQLEVLYRDMSDAEYVKLLKDTGGEYIREHDKVDWRDHAGAWHENATVVALCNDGCYVMDGSVFHVHKSDIRHHRAPTVEDVLTKFGIDWEYEDNCEDRAALLAEYAAKLRLAGDAE